MISAILTGVGGGMLVELLGLWGAAGPEVTGALRAAGVIRRLLSLVDRLKDRMTDEERREADAAAEEADRIPETS